MKYFIRILVFLLLVSAVFLLFYLVTQNKIFKTDDKSFASFSPKQTEQIKKIVHTYLLENPQILVELSTKLQEKEKAEEKAKIKDTEEKISKYKKEIFDDKKPGRLVLGNPDGKIIIAEFTQHQCPSCKKTSLILHKILKKHPEIKLIIIYWPFLGDDATHTAKAVFAAKKQNKAEELDHALFAHNAHTTKDKAKEIINSINDLDSEKLALDMKNTSFDKGLQSNFKLAQDLGLTGTPAFMITDKDMVKFALIAGKTPEFEKDLEKVLKKMK